MKYYTIIFLMSFNLLFGKVNFVENNENNDWNEPIAEANIGDTKYIVFQNHNAICVDTKKTRIFLYYEQIENSKNYKIYAKVIDKLNKIVDAGVYRNPITDENINISYNYSNSTTTYGYSNNETISNIFKYCFEYLEPYLKELKKRDNYNKHDKYCLLFFKIYKELGKFKDKKYY